MVRVHLFTPAHKAYDLYVAIWARNRGIVGGMTSHFGKGGRLGLY